MVQAGNCTGDWSVACRRTGAAQFADGGVTFPAAPVPAYTAPTARLHPCRYVSMCCPGVSFPPLKLRWKKIAYYPCIQAMFWP